MKKLIAILVLLATPAFGEPIKKEKQPIVRMDSYNIKPDRLAVLKDEVNEMSAKQVVSRLKDIDKTPGEIVLIIQSPGGSVFDGIEIIQKIETLSNPLVCIIDRDAYSMAAIIASYCPKVYAYKFARIMFHDASFRLGGTESIVESRLKMLLASIKVLKADTAKKLNIPLEEYEAKCLTEWWMTAEEAAENGFVSGVLDKLDYEYAPPPQTDFLFFLRSLFSFFPF